MDATGYERVGDSFPIAKGVPWDFTHENGRRESLERQLEGSFATAEDDA